MMMEHSTLQSLVETRRVRDFVAQLKKSNDRFRTISTYRMHYVRTGGGDNGGGCIWVGVHDQVTLNVGVYRCCIKYIYIYIHTHTRNDQSRNFDCSCRYIKASRWTAHKETCFDASIVLTDRQTDVVP